MSLSALTDMKKVIVIGCPGSGKSTFARALHDVTRLPLYHLDMLYWNSDKTTAEHSVFIDRLQQVLSQDEWIIDGNYRSTMEARMALCDTVFFLDYPQDVCLAGIAARKGKPRPDMPWIEEDDDEEFIDFIKGFCENERPYVLELLDKYADKNTITFQNRDEANAYLEDLRSKIQISKRNPD